MYVPSISEEKTSLPVLNLLLIFANIIIFIIFELSASIPQLDHLIASHGFIPATLISSPRAGIQSIFTSFFLVGSWIQLFANLIALFVFGNDVEGTLGWFRYLLFYLLSGLISSLTLVLIMPHSTVPIIGPSGAIAGIVSASLFLSPEKRGGSIIPSFGIIGSFIFLVIWLLAQYFVHFMPLDMRVAWSVPVWSYVSGFIAGLILVVILTPSMEKRYMSSSR